jgi:hypothetical protein
MIYQLSMYASLVDCQTGPDLESALYKAITTTLQKEAPDWSVAWGPVVVQFPTDHYAVNAMYVAQNQDTYVVGVAGTNPTSLFDWIVEDGFVSVQLPWIYDELAGAKISLGTGIGLAILQNAAPGTGIPGTGTTLREFLSGIFPKKGMNLVVSGHSLGGALAPTLALWLHDTWLLWDPFRDVTLSTMPTAGPTAGNAAFASYSDEKLSITRFANAIDVVPHAWQASDLTEIPTLYVPDIPSDDLVNDLVAFLGRISAAGDYTQLVDDTGWFPFDVDTSIILPDDGFPAGLVNFVNFLIQLAYQHTTAYNTFFGVSSPTAQAWAAQFQEKAAAAAPALAAAVAAGAATQKTAPVAGRPTVIPPGSDPRSSEVAAQVLAELLKGATPEQQAAVAADAEGLIGSGT